MGKAEFRWNEEKNQLLKVQRALSFEAVVMAIEDNRVLDDFVHPIRRNQRVMVVELDDYICAVPYAKDGDAVFLKTIHPNRQIQKKCKVRNEA